MMDDRAGKKRQDNEEVRIHFGLTPCVHAVLGLCGVLAALLLWLALKDKSLDGYLYLESAAAQIFGALLGLLAVALTIAQQFLWDANKRMVDNFNEFANITRGEFVAAQGAQDAEGMHRAASTQQFAERRYGRDIRDLYRIRWLATNAGKVPGVLAASTTVLALTACLVEPEEAQRVMAALTAAMSDVTLVEVLLYAAHALGVLSSSNKQPDPFLDR